MHFLNLPPAPVDPRHRQVAQCRIVDMLMLHGCAYEMDSSDRRSAAEARCAEALESWIEGGLGFALDRRGRRLFDPAETICFMKWSGANGHDPFWVDHWVKTARGFVTDLSASGQNRRFRVSVRRSFDLRRFDAGARLRLRLPLPLVLAYHRDIQVSPVVDSALEAEIAQSEGRLDVRLSVPGERALTIGADIDLLATSPTQAPVATRLDPAEAELYLRPVEDLIRVTPRIEALAARLAGRMSPLNTVNAFWAYLMDTLQVGAIRYDEVSPETAVDALLNEGWSDCQLGAALFISLCRARGLPARMLGGHFLYRRAPTKHYWAEVWLDGLAWLPFDCISWDLSAGGRDRAWRDYFAGSIEPRMVTECFPRLVTGPMSVRFPQTWGMLQTPAGSGIETAFNDLADGTLIYSDHITASRAP